MNYTLLLGAYLTLISSSPVEVIVSKEKWDDFKLSHNKSYESIKVERMRRTIFAHNLKHVEDFNLYESDQEGYTLGINKYSDLSPPEMAKLKGFLLIEDAREHNQEDSLVLRGMMMVDLEAPVDVDWREVDGRVTPVKDQGACGSCWAFSATGALEGQEYKRMKGFESSGVVRLSEQNLIDCDHTSLGCWGGQMDLAFETVKREGGIDTEASYPYSPSIIPRHKCKFNASTSVITDSGSTMLPSGDEKTLKEVVAKFGPVSVAIDASGHFEKYRDGVYYNKHCKNTRKGLDHAVLVVGYGTDPKYGDYWLVKNSWGKSWGDQGYIKMARNRDNHCGIATFAVIPIV